MTDRIEREGLRLRLAQPTPFLTMFAVIPSAEIVELAALAGFDGIILDTEHGPFGTEALPPLLLAARASGIEPIVRVRRNEPSLIGAALDAGAAGVLVPQIGSVGEAERALSAARFAPAGSRGANPWVRAAGYGTVPGWFDTADRRAAVLLMIEGAGGVADLDAILELPGLDGVFLGPVDLSHALGVPGQTDHALVREAMTSALRRARAAGVAGGVFAPTARRAAEWLDGSATLAAVGVDTAHIADALSAVVRAARA